MTFTVKPLSPALGAQIEGSGLAGPLAANAFRETGHKYLLPR